MSTKKKIKIAIFSLLGFCLLLFATLVVHIAIMVKGKSQLSSTTIQIARVDFQQELDADQLATIQEDIRALKGVKSSFFNPKSNILIYTFDNRENNAKKIYQEAIQSSNIISTRYVPSSEELEAGCPVINKNSFYGRLTDAISAIIN